jgi:phosphoribosylamine-glycine ligase
LGSDIPAALNRSNELATMVQFDGKFHRKDIGLDLIKLQNKN